MTTEAASHPTPEVLKKLDQRQPTSFYWSLTLLATLGGFLFGYDTANIGSVLDFIPYNLSDFAIGYLVAGASLGAAAGAFLAGPLTDRFGRKSLLIADAGIYAVGAILSAIAWNAGVLMFARTLIGLAVGADSAIATAYISEYAPQKRRGSLAMLQQWMITVGILISFLIAWIIFKSLPDSATTTDWRLILGLGAVPALIGLALRTRMPESPRWLLEQGRFEDVERELAKLDVEVSRDEVEKSAAQLERIEEEEGDKPLSRWTKGVRRALFVVIGFFIFQQITGINIPLYYGPHLLAPYLQGGSSAVAAAVAGVEATLILAAVNVIATYWGFRWIDRHGRRKLSMGGYAGMATFMVVSAIGVSFFTDVPRVIVVMIGLNLFIASFAIGVGGTGWLLQGEVFPTNIRGRAAAFGATADWVANFVVVQFFPSVQAAIGLSWVMVIFAGLCLIAIAFVNHYLPETKELSVEEVIQVFEKEAA